MSDILLKLHKQYGHIGYVDTPHKYYDLNTRHELVSVTTLIKKFQPDFDLEYWSKVKAKEYGITQDEVKKYWEKLKNVGTGKGSIVHDYLENRWFNKVFEIDYTKYIPPIPTLEFINIDKRQEKLISMCNLFVRQHPHLVPIRTELIVGNDKVAGQVDFLGYDFRKDCYVLIDYKTDKEIRYGNDYQIFKGFLMHLDDCEINKYSLQLSTYRELLRPVIPELCEIYIVWFNADNDNYKKIPIKNLDNESKQLLSSL